MHPSFEQFVAALRDPQSRSAIGLVIGDADAAALLTRHDWASDYYYKWLALFPVAAAAAAAAAPSGAPPAQPVAASAFVTTATPPPPPSFQTELSAVPVPVPWFKRSIPRWSRLPLIAVGSVVLLVMVGGYLLGQYHQVVDAAAKNLPVAADSPAASAPATAADASAGEYGLTGPEDQLMNAVLAAKNSSVDALVAGGMSEAQLRTVADKLTSSIAGICRDGKTLSNGFDNPALKSPFIAGYVATAKVTPDQAASAYQAVVTYCLAT